jgi:gluconolactonase
MSETMGQRAVRFPTIALPMVLVGASLSLLAQDPADGIVRLDPAIDRIVPKGAKLEKVLGGMGFTEGPVWDRAGGFLLFSDVQNNATMKLTAAGTAEPFRKPVFEGTFPEGAQVGSNGLAIDPKGRLVSAEHGNRRVTLREKDGTINVLADHFEGKRLNSPNDVVVKNNGDVYFTDPPGLFRGYPDVPDKPKQELDFNGVYRISTAGKLELLTKDIPFPNGIAFSPDEKKLYVGNSRPDKVWMVYDVMAGGGITNGRKFADVTKDPGPGSPDGMKVDRRGNVYATALTGVQIFSPEGKRLGFIRTPEIASNCAWGDADGKTLYITARTSLYRIRLNIAGVIR